MLQVHDDLGLDLGMTPYIDEESRNCNWSPGTVVGVQELLLESRSCCWSPDIVQLYEPLCRCCTVLADSFEPLYYSEAVVFEPLNCCITV